MCTKMFAQPVAEERHGKSIGNLSKIAKDDDGNVSKTIKLITQDKKRT